MIRSSRIPILLDRVCTDGILFSLLITNDGELLGHSTKESDETSDKIFHEHTDSSQFIDKPCDSSTSVGACWKSLEPSDVGALVAEVVEDYRRLGVELSQISPNNYNNNVGYSIGTSGVTTPTISPRNSGVQENVAGVLKNDSGSSGVGESKNRNGIPKGSLNCLITELEMGTVGVATASQNTYVIVIAEPTVNHGMLRGRLSALASHVGESFAQLGEWL
jgi:hypothetical protein